MKSFWRPCSLVMVLIAAACSSGGNADDSSSVVDDSVVDDSVVEDSVVEDSVVDDSVVDDSVVEDSVVEDEPVVRAEVKVGAVSSLSGPFAFTDASAAAAAVFDRYNADPDGLLTIEYIVEDDTADPAISAQVGRKLVDADNVALMAGSAGLADCSVNTAYYVDNGIFSVPGTGVADP
ncbi:MAG: ABC transporter substrate-binding protein, partial [Actinobacteria bacterium]|nr:ABC transporter substrate-binding protein [Actinomycetota bacterium]